MNFRFIASILHYVQIIYTDRLQMYLPEDI